MSSVIISSIKSVPVQNLGLLYRSISVNFPNPIAILVYIHHKFDHVFNILKLVHSILVVAICAFVYKSSNKYILKGY